MNKILTFLFILTLLSSCELTDQRKDGDVSSDIINLPISGEGEVDMEMPSFEFENDIFDFGRISQGEKRSHSFRFRNDGEADLVITKVEGSCGCTVLQGWPQYPISPGKSGKIDMIFDSNGKKGIQNKTISIVANTYPSTTILKIKGEVMAPD